MGPHSLFPKIITNQVQRMKVIPTILPPPKYFAQPLNGVCDIPSSQLHQAINKDDMLPITTLEEEYKVHLHYCKNNLHGRIIWPKGSTSLTVFPKISSLWSNLKNWGMLLFGKGFYEFTFYFVEDMRWVRTHGSLNLNPGTLKLFAWSKDFNPSYKKTLRLRCG